MPYSAAIIQRDFSAIYDNALKLGGCAYLRKLTYGNGWSRIRIGALVAVTPNGVGNLNDVMFTIGLCSGASYPGSSNITTSAVGFCVSGSPVVGSTRTMTYTANSSFPYYVMTSGVAYRKTAAGGYSVSSGLGAFYLPLTATGIQKRRFPIYVDITRGTGGGGSPNIIVYGVAVAATGQLDFRPDHFQDGLDQIGTPTIYNTALSLSTASTTLSMSDDLGPLDTFEIFWSSNGFPLEIYALGAVVINPLYNQNSGTLYFDMGGAYDDFTQYTPSAQVTNFSSYGSGFSSVGTVVGSSFGTTVIGLLGTSGGVPHDTFEQYLVGSVTSNVTLNAGTGWGGNGYIY